MKKSHGHWNSGPGKQNGPRPRPWPERFWAKVRKTEDGCWPWLGCKTNDGYGMFKPFNNNITKYGHRLAYELMVGPIPEGLTIDHLCRNRACCNPAHMEPVTHGVNAMRGGGPCAMNARKTHCKRGHEFTEENTRRTSKGRNCRACDALFRKKRQPNSGPSVGANQSEVRS